VQVRMPFLGESWSGTREVRDLIWPYAQIGAAGHGCLNDCKGLS